MVKPVIIGDGAWIGAKSILCPGVTAAKGAVLTAGSVASQDLDAFGIYRGNPALKIKERHID
jgi:putative colanic acid biosynthesis acetyltransferase WcaF